MTIRRTLLIGAVLALAGAVFGVVAAAGSARVTKGTAQAVFQASGSGGAAVLQHSKTVNGAPAQGTGADNVAIRPFAGSPFDGKHYCALDWHTIQISDLELGPQKAAAASLASFTVSFTLDGVPLATTHTPLKRFTNPQVFGETDLFFSNFGAVLAPSALAPGAHTVSFTFNDLSGGVLDGSGITFYIDPAGTGACL